jgi:hypothetical protein
MRNEPRFRTMEQAIADGDVRGLYMNGKPYKPAPDNTPITPALERQIARFNAWFQAEEIANLRELGLADHADFIESTGLGPQVAPRWLAGRLKAVQREQDNAYKRSHPEKRKEYKRAKPEKVRASKRRTNANWRAKHEPEFDALRLSRPMVVIDFEGQDYEFNRIVKDRTLYQKHDGEPQPDDIVIGDAAYGKIGPYIGRDYSDAAIIDNGVLYKPHGLYLGCASTSDAAKPTHILADPRSSGVDKRELGVKTILDWLLSLPGEYDRVKINRKEQEGAIFLMFGSGYDITQILARTSLRCAHNVVKKADYDNPGEEMTAPELWGEYAFSYLKGKWFDIWKLRDHSQPFHGNGDLDAIAHIKIFDVFGYFQKPFADVVDDMVKREMATEYEQALIARMKALRGKFASETIDNITEYCLAECRLLSKQMTELRELMFALGLKPKSWHGPGALANAAFSKHKVTKYFGDHISASNISEQQEWANHAFIGARIESPMQGYLKSGVGAAALHIYDVSSCYPAGVVELPSLAPEHGQWRKSGPISFESLPEFLTRVEAMSPVSMFKVRWKLPTVEKRYKAPANIIDLKEQEFWKGSRSKFLPFFPLPYRTKSGAILFPSSGYSNAMRDDIVAAIKWLIRFCPDFPKKKTLEGSNIVFEIEDAWIWEPNENAVYPFAFIRDYYNQRRAMKDETARTGVYNPMEIVIKLLINSIYGKLAQFVGEAGRVPKTANPYYAAAITAYGRRRMVEAGLIDPYAIIFFATDGVVSIRPLHGFEGGLPRVKVEGKDVISLGDWEYVQGDGGIFVGSGIYAYWKYKLDEHGEPVRDENGNIVLKPVAKLRGGRVKNYKTDKNGDPWLVANVLPIWRGMTSLPERGDGSGLVTRDYKQFITIGSALSYRRFALGGRWSPEPGEPMPYRRTINAHEMGVKRILNFHKLDELLNCKDPANVAKRSYRLIPTIPAINRDPALSRPREPEWIDDETGERTETEIEFKNVMAGMRA